MHIILNSIDADKKSETGSSRGGLRPYPLMLNAKEAGADAKLFQHGPGRHPIPNIPVEGITAHATMPGLFLKTSPSSFPHHNSFSFSSGP
jgi:hypothetical protein